MKIILKIIGAIVIMAIFGIVLVVGQNTSPEIIQEVQQLTRDHPIISPFCALVFLIIMVGLPFGALKLVFSAIGDYCD